MFDLPGDDPMGKSRMRRQLLLAELTLPGGARVNVGTAHLESLEMFAKVRDPNPDPNPNPDRNCEGQRGATEFCGRRALS